MSKTEIDNANIMLYNLQFMHYNTSKRKRGVYFEGLHFFRTQ